MEYVIELDKAGPFEINKNLKETVSAGVNNCAFLFPSSFDGAMSK
jgi:hypothetical protein